MPKKNFTGSMKSKNLRTLIPTTAREEQRNPPPAAPVPPPRDVPTEPPSQPAAAPAPSVRKTSRTKTPRAAAAAPKTPPRSTAATTVASFRIDAEQLQQLRALAYWERAKIQDIFAQALDTYFKSIPEPTRKKALTAYKKR